jgi:hypothetical protein
MQDGDDPYAIFLTAWFQIWVTCVWDERGY